MLVPHLIEVVTDGEKGTVYEVLKKVLYRAKEATKDLKGILGINCLVSAEMATAAEEILRAAIDAKSEDPEMREAKCNNYLGRRSGALGGSDKAIWG